MKDIKSRYRFAYMFTPKVSVFGHFHSISAVSLPIIGANTISIHASPLFEGINDNYLSFRSKILAVMTYNRFCGLISAPILNVNCHSTKNGQE